MKNRIAVLTIVFVLTSIATANEIFEDEPRISITFRVDALTQYVAPTGMLASPDSSMQSQITFFDEKYGIGLNVWRANRFGHSMFSNEEAGWSKETDWTVFLSRMLDTNLRLDAGISLWDLSEQFKDDNDMIFTYLKLTKIFGSLSPYIQAANYSSISGSTAYNGNAITIGVGHTIKINDGLTINSDIAGIRNFRIFELENSTVARFGTCLSWKLNNNTTLHAPQTTLWVPLESGTHETEFVAGAGFEINF